LNTFPERSIRSSWWYKTTTNMGVLIRHLHHHCWIHVLLLARGYDQHYYLLDLMKMVDFLLNKQKQIVYSMEKANHQ